MWDECCGTCASGTRTAALESGEITAETPEFILWSQNVEGVFTPSGSVNDYTTYFSDLSEENFQALQEVAQAHQIELAYESDDQEAGKYTIQYTS